MIATKLKKAWKEITLLGAWIATIAGAFLIPLPSWTNSATTSNFYVKFIIFFATVIAGFLVLYSLRHKTIKTWTYLSIISFILLTISFISYSYLREKNTLPYEGKDLIIGKIRIENDPLTILEKSNQFELTRENILKHVQGNCEKIWTSESINKNRITLLIVLSISYTLTACFAISFCNLIILYKEKYAPKPVENDHPK